VNAAAPAQTPLTEVAPAPTRKGGGEAVKKPAPVYRSPFSPYANGFLYCPRCGRWVPQHLAPRDRKGRPYCPYCGPGAYLRLSPRTGKRWEP
jgi:hypothetical protein